jgi:hypothetical protein
MYYVESPSDQIEQHWDCADAGAEQYIMPRGRGSAILVDQWPHASQLLRVRVRDDRGNVSSELTYFPRAGELLRFAAAGDDRPFSLLTGFASGLLCGWHTRITVLSHPVYDLAPGMHDVVQWDPICRDLSVAGQSSAVAGVWIPRFSGSVLVRFALGSGGLWRLELVSRCPSTALSYPAVDASMSPQQYGEQCIGPDMIGSSDAVESCMVTRGVPYTVICHNDEAADNAYGVDLAARNDAGFRV